MLTSGCSVSVSTVHALLFDISDQMEGPTLMSSFIVVRATRTRNKMALFPGLVTLYMLLLHLYAGQLCHSGVWYFAWEQSHMLTNLFNWPDCTCSYSITSAGSLTAAVSRQRLLWLRFLIFLSSPSYLAEDKNHLRSYRCGIWSTEEGTVKITF